MEKYGPIIYWILSMASLIGGICCFQNGHPICFLAGIVEIAIGILWFPFIKDSLKQKIEEKEKTKEEVK